MEINHIINPEAIVQYLKDVSQGNPELCNLMHMALLTPLHAYEPCLVEDTPANDTGGDLQGTFSSTIPTQRHFSPTADPRLKKKVGIVAEWLKESIAGNASWLEDTNSYGTPMLLERANTISDILHVALNNFDAPPKTLAEKYREAKSLQELESGIQTVMRFRNGMRLVKITGDDALQNDGDALGHCTRHGPMGQPYMAMIDPVSTNYMDDNYCRRMRKNEASFYSLRTPKGKICATIEVCNERGEVTQIRGAQNRPPGIEYMPYITALMKDLGLTLYNRPGKTGLIEQDGALWHINELPDNFVVQGGYDLSSLKHIPELPQIINGDLDLRSTNVTITDLNAVQYVGGKVFLGSNDRYTACRDLDHAKSILCIEGKLAYGMGGVSNN